MEYQKRENKPFILSKSNKPTLLPSDYQNFDESIESFIRYVQGANTFVAVKKTKNIKTIQKNPHF